MRAFLFGLASIILVFSAAPSNAQQRYCAGSCDQYGNPINERDLRPRDNRRRYGNDSRYPPRRYRNGGDESRYSRRTRREGRVSVRYSSQRRYSRYYQPRQSEFYPENRYDDDDDDDMEYGERREYREKRSYRRPRYDEPRRYRKRARRHYRARAPRTKFCRMETRRNADGWGRTKVRRCVLVRNDLLGNPHLRRGRYDW